QFQFQFGRHPEASSPMRLVSNSLTDGRIRMSQDHRSPGTNVIQQFVSVRVVKILPAAALNNQRLSADGTERPDRTVYAAHQNLLGLFEDFARTFALALQLGLRCTHIFSINL